MLVGAGIAAGAVGTGGGITSLVSYPALLFVGLAPLPASIVNTVAVVACLPGSAIASRPELRGRMPWLIRWGALMAGGAAAGSLLLLVTPPGTFARVVPFLLVIGALVLFFEPQLALRTSSVPVGKRLSLLAAGLIPIAVYNGYFGAGAGIMTLGMLLLTVEPAMVRANAHKNILVGMAAIISAVTFTAFGRVDWLDVVPLALGEFGGSLVGPYMARRVPAAYIRYFATLAGVVMAVRLWTSP